ncbi:LonA [Desulforapulum autotrophicum HRM2]|uniref:Lon protease n=1 Tax=Desulforapulum autotrophicum (strain ATCC 43914 / DSM 3382 / VKM B-1955 / HRM2) TaxID=177437 RepID=C0QIP4_DESAH|nr:endopeptidase La [Desulforapulum autotrophicum]ACN17988.1 LonA [Desulforapulum autotrophicum HRM2]
MNQLNDSVDIGPDHIPEILPILPIVDTNLFPKMVIPLVLMQEEAIALIDETMAGSRILGLLLSRRSDINSRHSVKDLHRIGTVAMILKMAKLEDNKAQLLIQGISRFKVAEYVEGKSYMQAKVSVLESRNIIRDKETRALMSNIVEQYEKIVALSPGLPAEIGGMVKSIQEPDVLADMVASTINAPIIDKQSILEILDVKKRLKKVTRLVNDQLEILEMGSKIQTQVKEDMDKRQREYYLRQQLKAIREELGETDNERVEIEEYRGKITANGLPEAAVKEADRELQRLSRMHPSSSEYIVASTYLDWLTTLPWQKKSRDRLDIAEARNVLNQDHYGLEKPKKRILEYLAVRKLKKDSKGPILCFAGPPGTGKTSLGKSIARALGRKFVRIALGGMRDEAEIRGHRRTYVGALPGRIIQEIRRAGTNNPVFMLDEIDKVNSSYHGDPSSALLEVLDPEQNFSFTDNYMDVPFDLSDVIFLTTANVLHTIPAPLRDRMEVLELSGYTEDEKLKIATRYLIPRQRTANGLTRSNINITQGAVKEIIFGYTREAGLRNLEREIGSICRGVAARVAESEVESEVEMVKVGKKDLHGYLGPVRYKPENGNEIMVPGVVVGLAWTPTGGEILFVEATAMKGSKGLTLTGQLGEVMKESATTAMSFIRSNAATLNIAEDFFETHDIHIHVPAGAIPKDGPSAGVTMLTALISLITGKPVKKGLAMTGEITLRGEVLPVGGIKDKVIAAHRAGIRTLIIPKWNEKDLEDIPDKVKEKIKFNFTDKMHDVIKRALN